MEAGKQLLREFTNLNNNPIEGIRVELLDDDIMKWKILIEGPLNSVYEGGVYQAVLTFCEEYPTFPPKLRFLSKIYHPQIYSEGSAGFDLLHNCNNYLSMESRKMFWSSNFTIESVLIYIIYSLSNPGDGKCFANIDSYVDFERNTKRFISICAENARKSIIEFFKEFDWNQQNHHLVNEEIFKKEVKILLLASESNDPFLAKDLLLLVAKNLFDLYRS